MTSTPTLASVHEALEAVIRDRLTPEHQRWESPYNKGARWAFNKAADHLRPILEMVSCPTCGGPTPCVLDDSAAANYEAQQLHAARFPTVAEYLASVPEWISAIRSPTTPTDIGDAYRGQYGQ